MTKSESIVYNNIKIAKMEDDEKNYTSKNIWLLKSFPVIKLNKIL